MRMRGKYPKRIAWKVKEYAPEIVACEAITVAIVANMTKGIMSISGDSR